MNTNLNQGKGSPDVQTDPDVIFLVTVTESATGMKVNGRGVNDVSVELKTWPIDASGHSQRVARIRGALSEVLRAGMVELAKAEARESIMTRIVTKD